MPFGKRLEIRFCCLLWSSSSVLDPDPDGYSKYGSRSGSRRARSMRIHAQHRSQLCQLCNTWGVWEGGACLECKTASPNDHAEIECNKKGGSWSLPPGDLYVKRLGYGTYTSASTPQENNLGREGPQTWSNLQPIPLLGNFFDADIFGLASMRYVFFAPTASGKEQSYRDMTSDLLQSARRRVFFRYLVSKHHFLG
jgi:hypothetical protein